MYNAISASGARVFFTAVGLDEARNGAAACAGPAPPVGELFAREEVSPPSLESPSAEMRTVAISEPSKESCAACLTSSGLRDAIFQGASEDGSKVFFTTEQELRVGARGENLYEYDFDAPVGDRIALLSVPISGDSEVQGVARISEDGSHVYFVAKGVLTTTANSLGNTAQSGAANLYVFAEGRVSFVATLSLSGDSGDWGQADRRPVMTSQGGRFLVFTSVADLTDEDLGGGKSQVFQYDALTDTLVRASIGQDGYNDDDRTPVAGSAIAVDGFPAAYAYSVADSPAASDVMSAPESGVVFFQSPDALTSQALNDQPDALGHLVSNVYEYKAGSVYLLSDGHDTSVVDFEPGASLIGSDPSGDDVFFFTVSSLIPQDGDTQQDIYDGHVDGGYATPMPSLGCVGEACLGAPREPPVLTSEGGSATETAEAEGSLVSPLPATVKSTKSKSKVKPKTRKARGKKKPKGGKRNAGVGKKANRIMLRRHLHRRGAR